MNGVRTTSPGLLRNVIARSIRDTRPPPFEHLYCERFYLAEPHRLYPDGVRGQIEAADAAKE
jgi:hypothetical protein